MKVNANFSLSYPPSDAVKRAEQPVATPLHQRSGGPHPLLPAQGCGVGGVTHAHRSLQLEQEEDIRTREPSTTCAGNACKMHITNTYVISVQVSTLVNSNTNKHTQKQEKQNTGMLTLRVNTGGLRHLLQSSNASILYRILHGVQLYLYCTCTHVQ